MDGYTVALEEGWYLIHAVEWMYNKSCYSALPINLVVEDRERISLNRGKETTNGTTGLANHKTGYFLIVI
jgi:hypothetical protein